MASGRGSLPRKCVKCKTAAIPWRHRGYIPLCARCGPPASPAVPKVHQRRSGRVKSRPMTKEERQRYGVDPPQAGGLSE